MDFITICEHYSNKQPMLCTSGKVPNAYKTFFRSRKYNKICISLSGGVDSMVSSWLLKQTLPSTQISAVHINYNNRETSELEAEFVKYWCKLLNIECSITDLNLKRENYMKHDRHYYENYTKKIRFQMYELQNCPVVLGHNYDDCVENVITNIASHKHNDNLKGMMSESCIDNVTILRPLLDISKSDIIAYAKYTNVPYLQDSTPSWSRRGKIRDHIIPTLNTIEPSFISGLMRYIS
jgi:tRNA(Ile)-lysidine synthetase-like protein